MATKRLILASLAATALLGACGSKENLKPVARPACTGHSGWRGSRPDDGGAHDA